MKVQECQEHTSLSTGAVKPMTPELIATLPDHAGQRALMNIAGELLAVAAECEARQIDEKLFWRPRHRARGRAQGSLRKAPVSS